MSKKAKKAIPPNLQPQAKMPPRPGFHRRPVWWLIKHWLAGKFLRGRLRCPSCAVVGTWKPYGYWWKDRNVKRWLCKWCGYYEGVDGRKWCVMDKDKGCWVFAEECPDGRSSEQICSELKFNPFAG